ncbi:DNA polymerase III subunit delta' [Patescibacteria group bacterium]|nr:DNA polymerase III subunit delta' [Patescibacteria group bacterium]
MSGKFEFDWPVVGQTKVKTYLQKSISNGSFSHAYLFYGPSKIGKTLTAKLFANTILCEKYQTINQSEQPRKIPCHECDACRQFAKNIYPDIYWVEREINEKTKEKKANITVAQIRATQEKINKRSFLNSYKIVIIPEAERMNKEACNSLLKTLEEPSARTVLILIASTKETLLPTILSRCQLFKFMPLTRDEIYDYLLAQGASRTQAKEMASAAQGRPTVAMKFLADAEKWSQYKSDNSVFLEILSASVVERFKYIDDFVQKKTNEEILAVLDQWMSVARDILLAQTYNNEMISNIYLDELLKKNSIRFSSDKLADLISRMEQTKKYLRQNINSKFALENLIINI